MTKFTPPDGSDAAIPSWGSEEYRTALRAQWVREPHLRRGAGFILIAPWMAALNLDQTATAFRGACWRIASAEGTYSGPRYTGRRVEFESSELDPQTQAPLAGRVLWLGPHGRPSAALEVWWTPPERGPGGFGGVGWVGPCGVDDDELMWGLGAALVQMISRPV